MTHRPARFSPVHIVVLIVATVSGLLYAFLSIALWELFKYLFGG